MKLRTLIIVAAAVAAIACGTGKPVELVPVELQTVATVDRISDTTFFSSPWSIKESSGDLYFLDATLNRVLRLDNDLRFRNYIGAKGRADNEFAMPTLMAISDDSVAVYDQSGKIKFFSAEGKYLGCTPLDKDAPTGDFAMQDGCIYFPTINVAQSAFVRLSDGVCTPFGTVDRDGDPTMLSIKNGRYISTATGSSPYRSSIPRWRSTTGSLCNSRSAYRMTTYRLFNKISGPTTCRQAPRASSA